MSALKELIYIFIYNVLFFEYHVVCCYKILTFSTRGPQDMVTNKTTKALSFILPVALLVSTNIYALDAETSSTAQRVLRAVGGAVQLALGACLLKYSWSTNSAAAAIETKTDKKVDVEVAKAKDSKESLVFAHKTNGQPDVKLELKDKAELPKGDLTKEALKSVVKDEKQLEDLAFTKEQRDEMKKAGWGSTIKNHFKPTSVKNFSHNIAPLLGAGFLVANGVKVLAEEAGLTSSANDDSAE